VMSTTRGAGGSLAKADGATAGKARQRAIREARNRDIETPLATVNIDVIASVTV
jgi:hypothetical protein